MEDYFSLLPNEIFGHIFSHLEPLDILNICLVSKQWFDVLNHKIFLKDVIVKISSEAVNMNDSLLSFNRVFSDYFFERINTRPVMLQFMEKNWTEHVYSLTFKNCSFFPFEAEGFEFQNLKVLNVIESDFPPIFSSLPNLKHFCIQCNFTDLDLKKLENTMTRLESLSILCPFVCESIVYRRYYKHDTNYSSDCILSYPAIESFIRKRVTTLKVLSLSSLKSDVSKKLFSMHDLRLSEYKCNSITQEEIRDLIQHQHALTGIDFKYIVNEGDEFIRDICLTYPLLKKITFMSIWNLDENIEHIFKLKKVEKISIAGCLQISSSVLRDSVALFVSQYLKHLNLSGTSIESNIIEELIPKIPNVQYLDLSACPVNDKAVSMISFHLKNLKGLYLRYCYSITDEGLFGTHFLPVVPISNLFKLTELYLTCCNKITENCLIETIRFKHLKEFNVFQCNKITKSIVGKLKENNPCLKQISIG